MNFLAHFHLAWPDPLLISGTLEGEFLRGNIPNRLSRGFATGIRLHRHIDAFTDQHELIKEIKSEFRPPLRRYPGILLDLSFDYYLSKHWENFNSLELSYFNKSILETLKNHKELLSIDTRKMHAFFDKSNFLEAFAEWKQISRSAFRIGTRLEAKNLFVEVDNVLVQLDPKPEDAFLNFYPKVVQRTDQFLSEQRYNRASISN